MRAPAFIATAVAAIEARRPFLAVSDPGVGKTSLIGKAGVMARISEPNTLISHLVVEDPTDAKGLPWIAKSKTEATFLPFGNLAKAMRATAPTLWFLDDIGQGSPATQASYMNLLLSREVNGHKLPPEVTFGAATNPRTAGMGVSGLLEPVKSRFVTIIKLEAHIDDWAPWAMDAGLDPVLIAYLRFDGGMLHQFEASADMVNTPSPRTWENFSAILGWGLDKSTEREAGAGAVGEGAASQYFAFREQFAVLPHADKILVDPEVFDLAVVRSEVLYAVVTTLAIRADRSNFANIVRFAERLESDNRGEFASLLMRDTMRRNEHLKKTPEHSVMMTGPVGAIISGSSIS